MNVLSIEYYNTIETVDVFIFIIPTIFVVLFALVKLRK